VALYFLKTEAIFKLQDVLPRVFQERYISLLSNSAAPISLNKQEINCPAHTPASTGD